MHPRVRQIPPGSSLSMIATLKFGLVWSIASTTYVAEPVPIEIRSYSFIVIPRVDSLNLHDRITMPRLLCVPCNATYLFFRWHTGHNSITVTNAGKRHGTEVVHRLLTPIRLPSKKINLPL